SGVPRCPTGVSDLPVPIEATSNAVFEKIKCPATRTGSCDVDYLKSALCIVEDISMWANARPETEHQCVVEDGVDLVELSQKLRVVPDGFRSAWLATIPVHEVNRIIP